MKKSIIIIGSGMGGLAAGIYGQLNGFDTAIFEAHNKPGGQCTSWTRKGYVFDACIHEFGGGSGQSKLNKFWRELGALPCEKAEKKEAKSFIFPDGTYFHNYYDLEKLQSHLKQISPDDAPIINEYVAGIRGFLKKDAIGALILGSFWEKLSRINIFLGLLKYFKYTMKTFGKRFKHPLLKKAFPLLHHSVTDFPLFLHLMKHADAFKGGITWPMGGSLTIAENMAERYMKLGGKIYYCRKAVKILTEYNNAYGVELEDGSRHKADFIVSNADGRKTIMQMLNGQYINKKISKYCSNNPDNDCSFAVTVFLGVKRDLSAYPSTLIIFPEKTEVIAGLTCDHLDMQIYGYDKSMAPAGKGVIKVELSSKPSYFSRLHKDKSAYNAEKNKIADRVIALLENQFQGLRKDIEIVDVSTLHTWEHYMGGTEGHNNYPSKKFKILEDILSPNPRFTLPGLKNFFFTGQWVTMAGALIMNALSGKTVVQKICRQCKVKFKKSY